MSRAKPDHRNVIYGLRDPRTYEIRYVGKSTWGDVRPKQHITTSRLAKDFTYKGYWLSKLKRLGLKPEIVILQVLETEEDLSDAEIWWIATGRQALGRRFTNLTDGGEGMSGYKATSDQRAKNSKIQKEVSQRPEIKASRAVIHNDPVWRERQREQSVAAYQRPDVIERQREASTEASRRPEVRKKHSEDLKRRFTDPVFRKKHSDGLIAANARPETKEIRRNATINWHKDPVKKERHREACQEAQNRPDVKQKQREAQWNRPEFTLETRTRMSESAVIRRARDREVREQMQKAVTEPIVSFSGGGV